MTVKIAALCLARLQRPVAKMAGTVPLTTPPVSQGGYDPGYFAGAKLVYFILHGLGQAEDAGYWYGDNALRALSASQVAALPLEGAFVFCGSCYGGRTSPMVNALFEAGALTVVTGTGKNVTNIALSLGTHWREWLERGQTALRAFQLARSQTLLYRFPLAGDIMSYMLLGRQAVTLSERTPRNG